MVRNIIASIAVILTVGIGQSLYKADGEVRLSPRLLNYQGYLTDTLGNPITINSLSMNLTIYDQENGGNALWTESQSPTVENGIFHVLLGSETPIPDSVFTKNPNRWLEIQVGLTALAPRTRIVSAAYAVTSTYADTALFAKTVIPDSDWIIIGSSMHSGVSGNVGIGVTNPDEKLAINGNIKVSGMGSGVIFPDLTKQVTAATSGMPSGGCILMQTATPPAGYLYTGNYISGVGQNQNWFTKADMPTARGCLTAVNVNGRIYAIGGWNGSWLQTNEEYDPVSNTWSTKANMPTARGNLAAAAVNNKIYAIGGDCGYQLQYNQEYDPLSNTWTWKASMPTARSYFSAEALDGKIYAIGGWNGSSRLKTNQEYDPVSNTWSTKADMPTARNSMGLGALNGKIYAIGGFNGSTPLQTNEEYDPISNTWSTKADMPTARLGFSATAFGRIFVISGDAYTRTNEAYDPVTNTWTSNIDIPTGRQLAGCESAGGKIYVIGGLDNMSNAISTNEEYSIGSTTYYIFMKY